MKDDEYDRWRAAQEKGTGDDEASEAPVRKPEAPVVRSPMTEVFGGPASIEMDGADEAPEVEERIHDVKPIDDEALAAFNDANDKKTDAVWYVVVGVVMLFMSSFHWGVGAGGVLMVVWGGARYARWSNVAKHAYDPWNDPDIDAWEEEQEAEG